MSVAYWYYPPTGTKFTMHQDIREAFPWNLYPPVITDEDLAWTGVLTVEATAPPEPPEGKVAVDSQPVLIDGKWYQRWDLVDAPPEPTQHEGE